MNYSYREAASVGQLTNLIAGLAVASSVYAQPSAVAQAVQEHLQIGGPGFAIPIPTPSPMPGGAYAITRPRMSTSSSLSGPVTRLTFSGANLPEGECLFLLAEMETHLYVSYKN